ncbi:hypothetical protein LOTGIDRAFT_153905 [Lottia gigantea]|uniref:Uncharacterized protein n=1 Tax=Lottia gigantea TaxID=225164 RepID=V4ADR6_LOTGI|nr:hypothetical protein LOTGIDRAFT_153905 [Lottia gigantea]ESO91461.1 hypothetical protein LOTGIDRAFT_153905 [Lottia gigantea]
MLKIRTELKDIIIDSIHDSRKVERTRPREVNIDEYYASTSADQNTHGHGVKRKHITDPVNIVIHDLSASDDDIQFTQNRYKIPKLSHQYKEDGSVNSDNVICQIDELLQDKQTSDKDSDFEESLEQEYNLKEKVGTEINPKVASIVTNLFINNKSKENITDIFDKYLRPGNLDIQLPDVNGEIWAFMKSGTCTKDVKFQKLGNKIVKCTYAVTNLTDQLIQIKKKFPDVNKEMTETVKKAMDSLTLLGSVFKDINQ